MLHFDDIVFGPIFSRRLGSSLGVNLLPSKGKLCNFDCIYCECGWNKDGAQDRRFPSFEEVKSALEKRISEIAVQGKPVDSITFSGNGEPTLHPDFLGIIQDTCVLRDQYCPKAKISVLSNSTQLFREDVVEALRLCDNRILKLDSAITSTMRLIDKTVNPSLTVEQILERLSLFDGDFTLQTCFLTGEYEGQLIDNTTPEELAAWYRAVDYLRPKQVMIYVIDRATPLKTLSKIPLDKMNEIAAPMREKGIDVIVSA